MDCRQSIPKHLRFTIEDFNEHYPDDDACLEAVKEMRFPNGIAYCEKCKKDRKHYRIAGRPVYGCAHCGTQISPMAGTIFEKSATSLRLWFYAMYLMASTRCGISAKQIQRETGVTYKTAWRMFKQIRSLLSDDDMQLEGATVEMDETYIGGKENMHHNRPAWLVRSKKTCVVGMVEREGRVRAVIAEDNSRKTLHDIAKEYILPASTVFTDDLASYHGLEKYGFNHRRINHSEKIYVMGDVHTQTIEGFWSLIKRGIGGVYHQVSKKYLQTYLNEYAFRYNRRHSGNLIFYAILAKVAEKELSKPSSPTLKTQPV